MCNLFLLLSTGGEMYDIGDDYNSMVGYEINTMYGEVLHYHVTTELDMDAFYFAVGVQFNGTVSKDPDTE